MQIEGTFKYKDEDGNVHELCPKTNDSTFVVSITGDDSNGYTADKTFAEISEAYNAGRNVICKLHDEYNNNSLQPFTIDSSIAMFSATTTVDYYIIALTVYITSSNQVVLLDNAVDNIKSLTVTLTLDETNSVDKTYDEIVEAYKAGIPIIGYISALKTSAPCSAIIHAEDEGFIALNVTYMTDKNELVAANIVVNSDNTVNFESNGFLVSNFASNKEKWTFTLEDGSTVEKEVCVG